MLTQFKIFLHALKRNGVLQLFFYLSNLDALRFVVYSKTMEYLDGEDTRTILDLGAGYSVLPSFIKGQLERNDALLTLDLNLKACKYQADHNWANMHQIRSDMRRLPIKSSSISVVIAISSIEHVGTIEKIDDQQIFKEIHRVMKEGGAAIISLPYSYKRSKIVRRSYSRYLVYSLHKLSKLWSMVLGKHLHYFIEQTTTDSIAKFYDDNEITDILSKCGFSLERRCYSGKKILTKLFHFIPPGWFVLNDFLFGLILCMHAGKSLENKKNARSLIFKIRK